MSNNFMSWTLEVVNPLTEKLEITLRGNSIRCLCEQWQTKYNTNFINERKLVNLRYNKNKNPFIRLNGIRI